MTVSRKILRSLAAPHNGLFKIKKKIRVIESLLHLIYFMKKSRIFDLRKAAIENEINAYYYINCITLKNFEQFS